ncbi:MAG TPA: nuclear transport factor 2 family protein [Anaeromyxobacter sp.]|nr:nuclear transport factor 2 family protein [Anaeromyxobacter sp.]
MSRSAERGADRRRLGAPHLVPLAAVAAAIVVLWRFGPALLDAELATAAAGAGAQVKAALAAQRRAAIDDVYGFRAGGRVALDPVAFADVTVSADEGRAEVLAVVEAQGRVTWPRGETSLGYVGREAFVMAPCRSARWCADGEQFASLRGVLTALFRRADAAAAADAEAALRLAAPAYEGEGGRAALAARLADAYRTPSPARVRAWQIRVERERASVGEDLEVSGADGAPERRRAVYRLAREDGRWVFVDGL